MAVVTKHRQDGPVYYVKIGWKKGAPPYWERVGRDKRQARSLNATYRRQVKDGTFNPWKKDERPQIGAFAADYLDGRTIRSADGERHYLETYVLSRPEFASHLWADLDEDPQIAYRLVVWLKTQARKKNGDPLAPKTVATIWGAVVTMWREARRQGLLRTDPIVLPKGTLQRKTPKSRRRKPYALEDVAWLLQCPDVHPVARIFAALALLTGMREGEVCGRRWKDWTRETLPGLLGSLDVSTQYHDELLKSDEQEAGEHARLVPVHPVLAELLAWWWAEGFEFAYCRTPTLEDFIVPRVPRGSDELTNHTKSSAYKMWRRACAVAGVDNITLHSTRHTFITHCHRGGARKEILELVTHNAAGETIDGYIHLDWAPLCEAVLCLRLEGSHGKRTEALIGDGQGTAHRPAPALLQRWGGEGSASGEHSTGTGDGSSDRSGGGGDRSDGGSPRAEASTGPADRPIQVESFCSCDDETCAACLEALGTHLAAILPRTALTLPPTAPGDVRPTVQRSGLHMREFAGKSLEQLSSTFLEDTTGSLGVAEVRFPAPPLVSGSRSSRRHHERHHGDSDVAEGTPDGLGRVEQSACFPQGIDASQSAALVPPERKGSPRGPVDDPADRLTVSRIHSEAIDPSVVEPLTGKVTAWREVAVRTARRALAAIHTPGGKGGAQ